MKRSILLITALLAMGSMSQLLPCYVTTETGPLVKGKTDQFQVKLFVECIHRRCPVSIEETLLETEGLKIEKRGEWELTEDGVYRLDLVVSITAKDKGEIRVLRKCPKHGLQKETLEITRP